MPGNDRKPRRGEFGTVASGGKRRACEDGGRGAGGGGAGEGLVRPETGGRGWIVAILVSMLFAAAPVHAQTDDLPPDLSLRSDAIVSFLNSEGAAPARALVEEHFDARLASAVPMARHVGILSQLRAQVGGAEASAVERVDAQTLELRVRSRRTGWTEMLRVRVDPEPPYRIRGLLPGPSAPPDELAGRRVTDREVAAAVRDLFDVQCDADVFSGAVLVAGPDSTLFADACGEADKNFSVPNRIDTKFNLGSMNKMVTAVAIARLVEAGELSFDDPLSEFLPDFPDPETAKTIRIEHLLTHTSGLGSYFNEEFRRGARARFRTVDDFMELAQGDSLAFEPGTDWRYSNTGFLVLGKVIEVVTGGSYHDYVRDHIYRPAAMENTGQFALDRVNPNLAVGYQKEYTDEGVSYRNNLFQHVVRGGPAGGGYSTVRDLLRFARALLAGELVGSEYVDALLSPKPDLGSPSYGYGFGIEREGEIVGHSGGFAGISSKLDIFPGTGHVLVVLSNYGDASMAIVPKVETLLLDER